MLWGLLTGNFLSLCECWENNYDHRSQPAVAPPGFCDRGEVRYGSIGGLEYEVLQSRLYCRCINVALCSTALQSICRVIRSSSMTMKSHTYYIIFWRPPIGGKLPPWRHHWQPVRVRITRNSTAQAKEAWAYLHIEKKVHDSSSKVKRTLLLCLPIVTIHI